MIGRLVLVAAIVSVAPARAVEPPAPLVEYHDDALTARLDNAPLGQVLDALAEATGAEITGPRDDQRRVSARFTAVPLPQPLFCLPAAETFPPPSAAAAGPPATDRLGEPPPPPPPTKRPPP